MESVTASVQHAVQSDDQFWSRNIERFIFKDRSYCMNQISVVIEVNELKRNLVTEQHSLPCDQLEQISCHWVEGRYD